MKKGFTLMELLVTIAVLSMIVLIVVPQVSNIMEKSRNDAYLETKKSIESAANLYRIKNSNLFPSVIGEKYSVNIQTLKDNGLIKQNIVDPRTNTPIINGEVIVELLSNGEYSYSYYSTNYTKDGLILWFDGLYPGNINNIWADRSGLDNFGDLINFNFTDISGWTNKGLKFDGVNDIVRTNILGTNFSSFMTGVPFTYSAYYTTNTISSWMGVISNVSTWGTGGFNLQYGSTQRTGLGGVSYISNTIVPTTDTDYHVLGVYNGSVMSLYINGVYVNQATISYNAGSSRLTLGAFYDTPSLLTNGTIHSVMFYNRALTLSEIQTNYEVDKERFNF
jgi:prepilin-type N-terminal cleavage/methylation domain-containing protein